MAVRTVEIITAVSVGRANGYRTRTHALHLLGDRAYRYWFRRQFRHNHKQHQNYLSDGSVHSGGACVGNYLTNNCSILAR